MCIALFLFLLCTSLGASAISAGAISAGRNAENAADRADYCLIMSCMKMFSGELSESDVSFRKDNNTATGTEAMDILGGFVSAGAKKISEGQDYNSEFRLFASETGAEVFEMTGSFFLDAESGDIIISINTDSYNGDGTAGAVHGRKMTVPCVLLRKTDEGTELHYGKGYLD